MKLSIDSPCHENWDTMKPNEKGAHCFSCQKTVIDFSVKTTQEIKSFFNNLLQTESICGRFNANQLSELSYDDFFKRFKSWHVTHKIAIILLFTFGIGLYSCDTIPEEKMVGELTVQTDTLTQIKSVTDNLTKNSKVLETEMKMGEILAVPVKKVPLKKQKPTNEYFKMMGDVAYEPDSTKKVKCVKIDSVKDTPMIMGKMMIKK